MWHVNLRVVLFVVAVFFFCVSLHGDDKKSLQKQIDHRRVNTYQNEHDEILPIKTLDQWKLRKSQILANMQKVTGELPIQAKANQPVTYKVLEEKKGEGYVRKTIKFEAKPGDDVVADLYLPELLKADEKRPGIVALHPTSSLGKRIVAGEGSKENRQYGIELVQRGYVVICPDYPSFGDLKDYDFEKDEYVSGTMKGIVNHMRCVDLLISLPVIQKDKIGAIGHSMGGHNAIFLGVFDERVKGVVSSCGWTPFHNYYKGDLKGWTSPRYMPKIKDDFQSNPDKVPFDFPELIASIAPRGFFSSSPERDSNFDMAGAKAGIESAAYIYKLHNKPDQLKLVTPSCDHDFPTEIREDAYKFLDEQLGHKPVKGIDYASELPRIESQSPEQALKGFALPPGFRIETTAHEPHVVDPVAMSFDADGNLYVIEMRGYSEDDQLNLGRIRFLEDTNKDGRFDKSTVFAEGMSWATAVICYNGGVFVGSAPDILYMKDTNGDHVADNKEVVFTGFGKQNVQALLNSFRWGLDNRIYGATSTNGGLVRRPGAPENTAINLNGRNFSFDPQTFELRPESGAAQHGMSFDDWGHLFVCANSNHFQMVMYEDRYAARNKMLKAPESRISIAEDGMQAVVFRQSPVEPWRIVRTRLRASGRVKGIVEFGGQNSGYFTSATGVTIFRGTGLGEAEKGTAFIGDVGSNIVHRKKVSTNGVELKGHRIDQGSEFIVSNDIWFRPVQFENGPDGALHVLDMYREVIEHPWSLPPEIKQHLDLSSGRDKGRLYRVVAENFKQPEIKNLNQASLSELVENLNHPNSWNRETASRLIYERQNPEAVIMLEKGLSSYSPLGKLHALYALKGLKALKTEHVVSVLESDVADLRRHGVRLSELFTRDAIIDAKIKSMISDPDIAVRYQLAFTLGEFPSNGKALSQLLMKDGDSSWIRFAAFSSIKDQLGEITNNLITDKQFFSRGASVKILDGLVEMIARRNQPEEIQIFADLLQNQNLDMKRKQQLYRNFALTARGDASRKVPALEQWRKAFVEHARSVIRNEKSTLTNRQQALRALEVSNDPEDVKLLFEYLDLKQPQELQLAALETLSFLNKDEAADVLINTWEGMTPVVRRQAQSAMYSRAGWTEKFFKAVLAQKIPRADVDRNYLQLAKTTGSNELKAMAEKVTLALKDSPRSQVIEKFIPALDLAGNVENGKLLFKKNCSNCHLLEGVGTPIGPNLTSFKNRGKETMLINILDPSREVTPEYMSYLVLTVDGRSYTGLLAAQSATTIKLQRNEGKPIEILRDDILELKSSGISLMPEGLEKDLSVEAFSDLIDYIMQSK